MYKLLIPIIYFILGYLVKKYDILKKIHDFYFKYVNKDRKFFDVDIDENGYQKITTKSIPCYFHKEMCKKNIILAVSNQDFAKAKLYNLKLKRYEKIHFRKKINNNAYKLINLNN